MKRARIKDLAREAGVSYATVDRIIHSRGLVREETVRKVADAAHRLSFYGSGLIDLHLATKLPRIRFGFLLIKENQEFYQAFSRQLDSAVRGREDVRGTCVIQYASSQSPRDLAAAMKALARKADIIACTAVNHPLITEAVLDLRQRGIAVMSLLNDFAHEARRHYVGLDNYRMGRLAAWMIATAVRKPGKVAVILGSSRWEGQGLREDGFRFCLQETAPDLAPLNTIINLETRALTHEVTLNLLDRHPDLVGLCVAGGGMEGAIAALREVAAPRQIALVVNELTSVSRDALRDGYATMVIATPLSDLCRNVVALMATTFLEKPNDAHRDVFLEPAIYLPPSVYLS